MTGYERLKAYRARQRIEQMTTPLDLAIARHKAAQAALDAVSSPEDYPKHLSDEENEALYELAFTPCASDAEF